MSKVWIGINVVTGILITILTFLAYAIAGIAEGPQPLRSVFWIGLWIVWLLGLNLQLGRKTRTVGIGLTFAPLVYYAYLFVKDFIELSMDR